MSLTVTSSIRSHNDEPSAIGVVTLEDHLVGKIIVSDEIPHDISSHQGSIIKITVGENLMELKLTASAEQYAEVKTLLDKARDSSKAASMLLKLAHLCADRSIPCECTLESNPAALEAAVSRKNSSVKSSVEGLLAWCPLSVWEHVEDEMLLKLSDALVLKLDELLRDAPEELNYDEAYELADQIHDRNFALLSPQSLKYIAAFVAASAENISDGTDWPASTLEPLILLSQLEYLSPFRYGIDELIVNGLKGDSKEISEEAKLRFVRAVFEVVGPRAVMAKSPSEIPSCYRFCQEVGLKVHEETGDTDEPLLSYLSEIPAAFAAELGRADFRGCIGYWDSFSQEGRERLTTLAADSPEVLFMIDASLKLPKEVARAISKDDVLSRMEQDRQFLEFIAGRLDEFRGLPTRVFARLNTPQRRRQLSHNFKSFSLRPHDTAQFIVKAMSEGYSDHIIEQLPDISDRILKKIDEVGHVLTAFKKECKILVPEVYKAYHQTYKAEGPRAAQAFAEKIWDMLGQLTAPGEISDEILNHPLYQTLLDYAYPDNSMGYAQEITYCSDRSDDFELFEVPENALTLNLGGAVTMALRNQLEAEVSVIKRIENLVQGPLKSFEHPDSPDVIVTERLRQLQCLEENGEIYQSVANLLERIGEGGISPSKEIKQVLVAYHAWQHPHFTQYAAESADRAEQAPNRDYAYLLELREFLTTAVTDSLTEAARRKYPHDQGKVDRLTALAKTIFEEEVSSLDKELLKYVAKTEQGTTTREVTAALLKHRASAGMRRVAGLCVSGDNPDASGSNDNIWDMENYYQLVLRDEQTRRCVGGVLLHYYDDGGKHVLTASLNPSSTLLYKVDEEAVFAELVRILGDFALASDIDIIAVSKDHSIRTNRTGGLFERALDNQIRLMGETFTLSSPEYFSYKPRYRQQELDVIWRNES